MISKKMEEAINKQINKEMYSGFLYMSLSAYADGLGLKGIAHWYMVQYHEEMYHAMKMFEHIQERNGTVTLYAMEQPPKEWDSVLQMFEDTLAHEQKVTAWINELMDLAIEEKDHASRIFLQWYVTEQVEEENNDNDIIAQLKLIKDNNQGLMMLDKDLGSRVLNAPVDFSVGVSSAV